jgi:hypothetical protein
VNRPERLDGILLLVPIVVASVLTGLFLAFCLAPLATNIGISNINAIAPSRWPSAVALFGATLAAFFASLYLGYIVAIASVRRHFTPSEIWAALRCPPGLQWSDKYVRRLLARYIESQ